MSQDDPCNLFDATDRDRLAAKVDRAINAMDPAADQPEWLLGHAMMELRNKGRISAAAMVMELLNLQGEPALDDLVYTAFRGGMMQILPHYLTPTEGEDREAPL